MWCANSWTQWWLNLPHIRVLSAMCEKFVKRLFFFTRFYVLLRCWWCRLHNNTRKNHNFCLSCSSSSSWWPCKIPCNSSNWWSCGVAVLPLPFPRSCVLIHFILLDPPLLVFVSSSCCSAKFRALHLAAFFLSVPLICNSSSVSVSVFSPHQHQFSIFFYELNLGLKFLRIG